MTKKPKISAAERDQIGILLASGCTKREIARKLGRSSSSICYEISHNAQGGTYQPILANSVSRTRNQNSRQTNARKNPELYPYVVARLREGWSPEQIAGRLRKRNHDQTVICPETIYRHIYGPEGRKHNLKEYLTRAHKHRFPKHYRKSYRRGISNRVSISLRPEDVNSKTNFGHWEADVVEGKGHSGGIQTLLERKTRYYQARLIPNIDSEYGIKAQKHLLSKLPYLARQSVTFDNGRENYNHYHLTRDFETKTYFCDPYAAWQKGAVENHNGILRRYIPKKSDLSKLPQWEPDLILEEINNKPRKCLNWATPKEAFRTELKSLLLSKCSDSF